MSNQPILPGGGLVHDLGAAEGDFTVEVPVSDLAWESKAPTELRVAQYPDGRRIIQGAYRYQNGGEGGYRWRDLPCVEVDENGVAL